MAKIIVFGTGSYLKKIFQDIEDKYEVLVFIDNQINKQNTYIEGKTKYKILAPEEIVKMDFDKIVIASIKYASEMLKQLLDLGVKEHDIIIDYVCISKKIYIYDFLKMQVNRYFENNRLDIAVKLLAIENYYHKNDYGYRLYKEMQKKRLRISDKEADVIVYKFKDLIKSFEKNGFIENSYIVCDEKMRIIDGAHRIALCLYFNINFLNLKIVLKEFDCEYSKLWFWENSFKSSDIKVIMDKYDNFWKNDKEEITAILWPPAYKYFDEITFDLSQFVKIDEKFDMECLNSNFLKKVVYSVYAVDDIAEWKIKSKLEYMKAYPPIMRVIRFKLKTPIYRLKEDTYFPLSVQVEKIKRVIRKRYQEKINPYFYDIIIHITDNYYQSYMLKNILVQCDFLKMEK